MSKYKKNNLEAHRRAFLTREFGRDTNIFVQYIILIFNRFLR